MPRPRTFDEPAVLDAAIDCFWRRGFEATSVRDLAERMGIGGASLYNAFGDKHALFRRALERYAESTMRERIRRLEGRGDPKAAIRGYFDEVIARSLADRARRGCMLVNSALEIAPHDRALRPVIAGYLDEIRDFFRRNVAAAQAAGQAPPGLDADEMSRLLLGVFLGLRVLARALPDRALLEGIARPALALLETPPSSRKRGSR